MTTSPQTIEVTAGEVAAELKRRGISSDERVTLTIEPEQELISGRRASRAHEGDETDRMNAGGFGVRNKKKRSRMQQALLETRRDLRRGDLTTAANAEKTPRGQFNHSPPHRQEGRRSAARRWRAHESRNRRD